MECATDSGISLRHSSQDTVLGSVGMIFSDIVALHLLTYTMVIDRSGLDFYGAQFLYRLSDFLR